jgi:hypothetical protein
MPPLSRQAGKWVVILALTFSVGGHWAALQSLAWMNMVARYAQTDSWAVALQKTFDGQHPCNLCKLVAHGKQSEKKPDIPGKTVKIEFSVPDKQVFLLPPPPLASLNPGSEWLPDRVEAPPTPPPRRQS